MVKETSLTAYLETREQRETQAGLILFYLLTNDQGLTRAEISRKSGISINAVCGRVNRLIKFGLAFEAGIKKNPLSKKFNSLVKPNWQKYTHCHTHENGVYAHTHSEVMPTKG